MRNLLEVVLRRTFLRDPLKNFGRPLSISPATALTSLMLYLILSYLINVLGSAHTTNQNGRLPSWTKNLNLVKRKQSTLLNNMDSKSNLSTSIIPSQLGR